MAGSEKATTATTALVIVKRRNVMEVPPVGNAAGTGCPDFFGLLMLAIAR
jgi:hypothetical protein